MIFCIEQITLTKKLLLQQSPLSLSLVFLQGTFASDLTSSCHIKGLEVIVLLCFVLYSFSPCAYGNLIYPALVVPKFVLVADVSHVTGARLSDISLRLFCAPF